MSELSRGTKWSVPVAAAVLAGGLALGGCGSACKGTEVAWKGNLHDYGALVPVSLSEAASLVDDQAPDYVTDWTVIKNTVTALLIKEAPPAGMTFQVSVGANISQYPGLATETANALPAIASKELGYPVGGSPDGAVPNDLVEIFVEPIAPPPTCELRASSMGAGVGAMSIQDVGLSAY
jgi:hypothetical protein